MRIQNSIKNMYFGIFGQLISIMMGFIVRSIFIINLGIEYLGIDGLFSSVLIMLSLANLGFDSAMIFSLYKPLAENDSYKIKALMNLYKRAYQIIGLVVLIIGLSILPFLPYVMNGGTNVPHINLIYILFLLNSVSSYYFIYKQSIIIADQKTHIISKIHTFFVIITNIIVILLLVLTKQYIPVLIIQIIFRISENIFVARKADQLFPFLKNKNDAKLTIEERVNFFQNLYALFLYKISGVVINGTDNIVIAKYVGITSIGIYANYLLIISTLNTFLSYFFHSINASVGNLLVKETTEKKFFVFRVIHFTNFWFYGICSVCLLNLLNPFIIIWIGETYIFNKLIVFSIVLNFFTSGMQNACTTFRETSGLFMKGKYRPIFAALINIISSIILIQLIGIAGVFFGTIISRICTYFWYDPLVIFRNVFKKSTRIYFINYAIYFTLVVLSASITYFLCNLFNGNGIMIVIFQFLICIIIPNVIFYLIFRKSEEFLYLFSILKSLIAKVTNNKEKEIA